MVYLTFKTLKFIWDLEMKLDREACSRLLFMKRKLFDVLASSISPLHSKCHINDL